MNHHTRPEMNPGSEELGRPAFQQMSDTCSAAPLSSVLPVGHGRPQMSDVYSAAPQSSVLPTQSSGLPVCHGRPQMSDVYSAAPQSSGLPVGPGRPQMSDVYSAAPQSSVLPVGPGRPQMSDVYSAAPQSSGLPVGPGRPQMSDVYSAAPQSSGLPVGPGRPQMSDVYSAAPQSSVLPVGHGRPQMSDVYSAAPQSSGLPVGHGRPQMSDVYSAAPQSSGLPVGPGRPQMSDVYSAAPQYSGLPVGPGRPQMSDVYSAAPQSSGLPVGPGRPQMSDVYNAASQSSVLPVGHGRPHQPSLFLPQQTPYQISTSGPTLPPPHLSGSYDGTAPPQQLPHHHSGPSGEVSSSHFHDVQVMQVQEVSPEAMLGTAGCTSDRSNLTIPPPPKRYHHLQTVPNFVNSPEYRTLVNCTAQLEIAFHTSDRDVIHLLLQEGLITEEVHEDFLNSLSLLNKRQRAGKLVSEIKNKVKLSAGNFYTFLNQLYQREKQYESIINILNAEYNRQQQACSSQCMDSATLECQPMKHCCGSSQASSQVHHVAEQPLQSLSIAQFASPPSLYYQPSQLHVQHESYPLPQCTILPQSQFLSRLKPTQRLSSSQHMFQLGRHPMVEDVVTDPHRYATHMYHNSFLSPPQPPQYMLQLGDSLVLSRYRTYLKNYYSTCSIAQDDKLSIAPCTQFINLALVKKEEPSQHDHFSRSTFYGGEDEIRARKIPLELDALVLADTNTSFILVEGPPGIGKSTLCWELCRKWDFLKSLQHYKIVLQLKLRERRVQNINALAGLFYHEDKVLSEAMANEVRYCEGNGVLLIMDGLDEMPTSVLRKQNSLIFDVISGKCLPGATRLITTRPSALCHKHMFPVNYRHIEILGFTDECKVEFAQVAFQSEPDVLAHFKDFIFSNLVINSLMYIPVNCAIIAQVYKDIRRSRTLMPKTMTQLYSTLVLVLIRRHMIEKGKWKIHSIIPKSLAHLPESVHSALNKVSELAYKGLTQEDIQIVFTDEDVGENFEHLGLLSEAKEMYLCEGAKSSYSFPHLSIQEFLAAWHLVCNFISESFYSILRSEHLQTVKKFIAGLLGCSCFPIEWVKEKTVFMVHCLYEAQNSCKSLEGHEFSGCIEYEPTTPLDMYAFGYVLVHAPIQWELNLEFYSDVSQLIKSCNDYTRALGCINTLIIIDPDPDSSLSLMDLVPRFILTSIQDLAIRFCDIESPHFDLAWMSSMTNLSNLELSSVHFSSLALGSFSMLRKLTIIFEGEMAPWNEVKEMSKSLSCSSSLECASIRSYNICKFHEVLEVASLVSAALSVKTLKSLETDVSFAIARSNISPNLETITVHNFPVSHNCFCNIAGVCKMPSMRSFRLEEFDFYDSCSCPAYDTFLVLLNHSLYSNTSFQALNLNFFFDLQLLPNYQRGPLSKALRTNFSLFSRKKSKSLNDLTDEKDFSNELILQYYYDHHHSFSASLADLTMLSKSQSCPDLLQMQALHNMHPLLHKALNTDRLYVKDLVV